MNYDTYLDDQETRLLQDEQGRFEELNDSQVSASKVDFDSKYEEF